MKLNEKFEAVKADVKAWETEYDRLKALKNEAAKRHYSSEDKSEEEKYQAACDALEAHKRGYPLTTGGTRAFRAVYYSKGEDVLMTDSCWQGEHRDFINALRDLGVKSFLVANESTGLMTDIFGYTEAGAKLVGPEYYTEQVEDWYGKEEDQKRKALRFTID